MGLGDKVKETLDRSLEGFAWLLLAPVKEAIAYGLETILDVLGERFGPKMAPLVETLEATGQVPKELQPWLTEMKDPKGEVAALLSLSAAQGGLGLVSGSIITTLTSGLTNSINALIQPSMMDVGSLIKTEWNKSWSQGLIDQEWLWLGVNTDRRKALRAAAKPLLGLETLRFIYNRFPNQAGLVDFELQSMGFNDAELLAIKQAFAIYPGTQDLIHMAVREAFSPDIVAQYGLSDDFPEEFANEIAKQGLTREWALKYWQSHWILPSVHQGYEMYHRGKITLDQLKTLMRTLDIMPFWRDPLIEIAYRPFTRVDVRRMHALGVLDRSQVKRAYLDLGYNDEKAELMTQFTEEYNSVAERNLNKTEILQLYRTGNLEYDEAYELLNDLGYDSDSIDYLLQTESAAVAEEARNLSLTQVKNLALAGIIDRGEATGRLSQLGYDVVGIERILQLWDLEVEPNFRQPSRTDLENFWEKGIIDDNTWYERMIQQGYEEDVIVWYYLEMSE